VRFFGRPESGGALTDRFGRRLDYIRISVTDRCNMRCDYCRPASGAYRAESHANILRYEEIGRIARVAAAMGVKKLRITGGEPLVRRDLPRLIAMLAQIPGIEDLSMTTNATLLAGYAGVLAASGLHRVNISLDSLNSLRFRRLTGGDLRPVLEGVEAAAKAGLSPIRLNTVLMRGVNDGEAPELIRFAVAHRASIRFIELMPMKVGMDWRKYYLPVEEVLDRTDVRALVDVEAGARSGNSAAYYLPLRSGDGEVGFISPMSGRFCGDCNRLRLTADGHLRSCLPADGEIDLRELIRGGGSDEAIRAALSRAALIKPEVGVYGREPRPESRSMIHVGG
jgi:cyclic pyranopterin phosphate synthase